MAESDGKRASWPWLALVLLLTALAYAPCLGFDFVFDDHGQIVDNPALRSWARWTDDFTRHVWASVFPGSKGSHYRPVFVLWLRTNAALFGLAPWAWHLSAIAIHLLATALAFALARRLLVDTGAVVLAALVFGLHPIHAESVAWVSGATDPLMTVFAFAATLAALRGWSREGPARVAWLTLSCLSYALALLSKEVAVVLPALLAAQLWLVDRERRGLVLAWRLAPFAIIALLYLLARRLVLGEVGPEQTSLTGAEWALTTPQVLAAYGARLLWPTGLSAFCETPPVNPSQAMRLAAPLLGLLLAGAALLFWRRRDPESRALGIGLAWLLLPLAPMLMLPLLPRGEFVHDRYLYLPSFGFALLTAGALQRLCRGRPRLFLASAVLLSLGLGGGLVLECRPWRDDLALFQRAIDISPDSAMAHNNLASELNKRGRSAEAIAVFEAAIARDPELALAHYNLGMIAYRQGRRAEARRRLERSVALEPGEPDGFVLLAVILKEQGAAREAQSAIERAIALRPRGRGYHFIRGQILGDQGRILEAIAAHERELAIRPGWAPVVASLRQLRARRDGAARSPSEK